jgi:succinyldiaminopimelate transaminase
VVVSTTWPSVACKSSSCAESGSEVEVAVTVQEGFRPPPYPFDRLDALRAAAERLPGGVVDLSAGSPCDPPPDDVVAALSRSAAERGYPASPGTPTLREAVAAWFASRLGVALDPTQVAACVGTKELVAGLPHWLRLRTPARDTILYPAISYPTYAMGATLAGCRAVRYHKVSEIEPADAARALCLWVNSPSNPTGELTDLAEAAAWGRANGVPVLSDECYVDFTWDGHGRTILQEGSEGVLALHSLSKRSNLAGLRVGWYAGDAELVRYLSELRKHAGFMLPGPVQAAAVVALADEGHVDAQRQRYRRRLETAVAALRAFGVPCDMPAGAFYVWARAPGGDGWQLALELAEKGGALVAPGDFYGPDSADHVRLAMVQPDDRLALFADRLTASPPDR